MWVTRSALTQSRDFLGRHGSHADVAYFPLMVSKFKISSHLGAVRGLQPPESRDEKTRREGVSVQGWRLGGRSLDPGNDVSHQVSVNPVDDASVHVCHLKQGGDLGISGAAIYPDHVCHPPVAAVINDHRHACPDMQKTGSALGAATPLTWSTDIPPAQVRLYCF